LPYRLINRFRPDYFFFGTRLRASVSCADFRR
jgi:hypothetical protein